MSTDKIQLECGHQVPASSGHTWHEIRQQPALWPTTLAIVQEANTRLQIDRKLKNGRVLITGAGTSAYAGAAVAAAWPGAMAVPSTDLLFSTERCTKDALALISLARSGNSPESMAVVNRVHRWRPDIWQLAITCNANGALATSSLVDSIILDPRTNDQSLVMTSSFSNLLLGGLCLVQRDGIKPLIAMAVAAVQAKFELINQKMSDVARGVEDRVLLLASASLFGCALEGALKVMEMTAGRFPVIAETFLGLRHGPMSFIRPNTRVVCLMSNDARVRRYEQDLVCELREKRLGYLIGICDDNPDLQAESELFDCAIPALLPHAPDDLRAPFEILGLQLLGYHLSLLSGLNPDSPSPGGVINRVVQGVRTYE